MIMMTMMMEMVPQTKKRFSKMMIKTVIAQKVKAANSRNKKRKTSKKQTKMSLTNTLLKTFQSIGRFNATTNHLSDPFK